MCRYTHDVPKVTIIHLVFLKAEEAAAKEVLALRRNSFRPSLYFNDSPVALTLHLFEVLMFYSM